MNISVIVPVYNAEASLPLLIQELVPVLATCSDACEILLVNDGSRDASWTTIQALAKEFDCIRGINLRRNYGQHNALLCGIRAARFQVSITMDDDLQHPPREIPALLKKLDEGYDLVYGTPRELPHEWWRNFLSRLTKLLMSRVTQNNNIRYLDAFRAFRTDLREAFADYTSPNLLLDVLLTWGTTRIGWVAVDHLPRQYGKSNYNFTRLFDQLMLMLTGYSVAPLRFASIIGFGFTLFGILVLVFVIGRTLFFGGSIPGFPFLASTIAVFSGAQLFALGIIGEYLARVFNRTLDKPTYLIRETTEQ